MVRTRIVSALVCALLVSAGAHAQPGSPSSVAFHSSRTGNNAIYVMDPDGSNQVPLTFDSSNNQRADLSPDGRHIVFASNRFVGGNHLQICLMNSDGTGIESLPEPAGAITNTWPRWSPDGEWIAFQSNVGGTFQIWEVRGDGTELTQITASGANQFPAWSPDGTRLAMRRNADIYVMDLTGRPDPGQLTTAGPLNQMPSWSPDGAQIAFMSTREPGAYPSVFVMNADGTDQIDLTPKPTAETGAWSSRAPAWSPNGQYIYFTGLRPGMIEEQIFVMRADGTEPRSLTLPPGVNAEATVRHVIAPRITGATATPNLLWPPNNQTVAVAVAVSVSDDSDPAPACRISDVTSNEALLGNGWQLTGALTLELLAQRVGGGAGRTYTITVTCTNSSALSSIAIVTVDVPHDQRR